jgi:hypothetical protein
MRGNFVQRFVPAFVYFVIVYACGFAIGVVREFVITPRTGLTLALWIELPIMVTASFFGARFVLHRFGIRNYLRERLTLGFLALLLLVLAEEIMSWALRGVSVFTLWAHFSVLAGIANFVGLLLFAMMPMMIDIWAVRHQDNALR